MKNKFIEAFTDIDDEFIESAKPTAQKPLELKAEPRRFSWKKLTAAAACVAVLGAGGIAAAKLVSSQLSPDISDSVMGSGVSLSAASSGNSITDDMTDSESLNDPTDSSILMPDLFKITGKKFEYNGKSYGIIDGDSGYGGSNGYKFIVGVRREITDGVDTVEFAAFVENIGIKPIGLMSTAASPDKPVLFRFELNDESVDTNNVFDKNEFKYMAIVLQPGERYFQTASFPITEAEYMFSACMNVTNPEVFDESKSFRYNTVGGHTGNRWADFSDKSFSFDDVYKLFGSSKLSKELAAAANSRQ